MMVHVFKRSALHATGAAIMVLLVGAPAHAADPIDVLRFGDPASESAHHLGARSSEVLRGALGQSARRFLPRASADWRGGEANFTLAVDPKAQNYLSVKLWGEDINGNQATLYCDGKQLGYRQLSDADILDQGAKYAVAPGRFHYVTHTLPLALTSGKTGIACRMRLTGPIWRYGSHFAQFQKPMTEASRGFYALIVHSDKMVPLGAIEGQAPPAPIRQGDGAAVLDALKKRVDQAVVAAWSVKRPPNQLEMSLLAKAYEAPWSRGYHAPQTVSAVLRGIDGLWAAYQRDPAIVHDDPATPNPGWFGLGLLGETLRLVGQPLLAQLDAGIAGVPGGTSRRAALERMFVASRDWNLQHRRLYTNQCMIKDTYGIWYANEGLIALGSPLADTRERLLPLLYESVGLLPWSGSRDKDGKPTWQAGEGDAKFSVPRDYHETTALGLTRELGYVGGYGEVLDWVAATYDATRPRPGLPGDARILAQLVKIAKARAYFRYPHWDADGNRTMRLEAAIGWRDIYAPGDAMYAQRPSWDASPLQVAVATGDPALMGYAQQMLVDNQFFESVAHMMETNSLRATIGLIALPTEYDAILHSPAQPARLPMSPGAADFVFADSEDGVLAVKHGDDVLYASLYWRANSGISGVARVHLVTGQADRVATVRLDREEFEPSGLFHVRANNPHINNARLGIRYPDDGSVWGAGELQPVAKLPAGVEYLPDEDNPYAGRADFYVLRYGHYLIAMNSSASKSFQLDLPRRAGAIRNLANGLAMERSLTQIAVGAGQTLVLYLDQ